MSDPVAPADRDAEAPSDAELISRVRGGDVTAYGELFARHRDAANRLARQLVRGPDSDDLVAEAFAKVLTVLQGGGGPDVAFRAYLLTAVRRLHIDRVRSGQRLQTSDDMTQFDPGVPFQDTAVASFDNGAAARAFASLPERWQLVLWHLEVERNKPADIAPLLGMSPNSVSALAYRAREGLRQAFLTMHLSDISDSECQWVNEHLGAFVRNGLAKRDAAKVRSHLEGCRRCTAMYVELEEVNSNLAAIIAPLLLGTAAAGYLASVGTGATAAGAAGAVGGLAHIGSQAVSRTRDFVVANTGAATAAGIAATVAAAAMVAVAVGPFGGGDKPSVVADPGAGLSSSVPLGSDVPSAVSPRPSPTLSPSSTPSVSPSGHLLTSPSPTLSLRPSTAPSSTVPAFLPPTFGTYTPSATPSPRATSTTRPRSPAATPTSRPTTRPTAKPTSRPTQAAGDPGPAVVADPVIASDGSVRVRARNLHRQDRLAVVLRSTETTFPTDLGVAGCRRATARRVTCTPRAAARLGAVAAGTPRAATGRVAASLPLAFPEWMVTDDVEVTATVGDVSTTVRSAAFRPSRTPSYDFAVPVLERGEHSVTGTEDRYALTATASLPPHVTGVAYTVTGAGAHLVASDDRCTVTAERLVCPTVAGGDRVALLVGVPDLTGPATIQLTASPIDTFTDPDRSTTLTVEPGADLGLQLGVQSASPDRTARVTLSGQLSGVPPGLAAVVYTLHGGATWPGTGNPGCTPADLALTCPAAVNGLLTLTVVATHRNVSSPLTISVAPVGPFQAVGLGPHAADVELPGRPVQDLSLGALAVADGPAGHAVVGTGDAAVDRYTLTMTVTGLPAGSVPVDLSVRGGSFAADQGGTGCTPATDADQVGGLTCAGLVDGAELRLVVDSTATAGHDLTVTAEPGDPYDDLTEADNTRTVTVAPGAALALSPRALGPLHQDADGDYPVTTSVTGIRPGVDTVRLGLPAGLSFAGTGTAGCTVTGGDLLCTGLADGDPVDFTVRSATPATATGLTVTATPGDGFVAVGDGGTATGVLAPSYDFSVTGLAQTGHTLAGGTDTYVLRGTVAALPAGLDALGFALTGGGSFADVQPDGCTRIDDTHVRCTGLGAGGPVTFRVDSTDTSEHAVDVRVLTPAGYDDPQPADDVASATGLRPGVDLHLADLRTDEASAGDDDRRVLSTRLEGVRAGLGTVTYALTGDAAFSAVNTSGCDLTARTVTCQHPADGPVDLTVVADDAHADTPVTVSVRPGEPFTELADADNASTATLAARPVHDFGLGSLTRTAHTITGDVDHYTLRSTVRAVPAALGSLELTVEGGTFAEQQDSGCARVDATTLRCTDLAADRAVDFGVDSSVAADHDVRIAVRVPRGYDDPDPGNDAAAVTVSPAVDLSLGPLTPSAPVSTTGAYEVGGVLHGVRSGPVTLTVSGGATLTGSSCALTSDTVATCGSPTEGGSVRLSLQVASPTASATVTVHARAAAGLVELDDADNTATATLAPDVSLAGLRQSADGPTYATVRASVTGVPVGTTAVRVRLSGPGVGVGAGEVHFTLGADGAEGDGPVDCRTTDAVGTTRPDSLYASCGHLTGLTGGTFGFTAQLAHGHDSPTPVTFTVLPVGVDQGPHTDNDASVLSIR